MYHHKKLLGFAIAGLLLFSIGCGTARSTKNVYTINITKSEVLSETQQYESEKKEMGAKDLLEAIDPKATTKARNGKEMVTKLDGVIATMSKSWQIYINTIRPEFIHLNDVRVKPTDVVSWQYEPNE